MTTKQDYYQFLKSAKEKRCGSLGSISTLKKDEMGTLATSFNQMTTDLNTLVNNLEVTIEARTKDLEQRAVQLEASALVARQAAEVRDVTTLLDLVVNLIPQMFNYYHAGIFHLLHGKELCFTKEGSCIFCLYR